MKQRKDGGFDRRYSGGFGTLAFFGLIFFVGLPYILLSLADFVESPQSMAAADDYINWVLGIFNHIFGKEYGIWSFLGAFVLSIWISLEGGFLFILGFWACPFLFWFIWF
jgi:hypothetical protein